MSNTFDECNDRANLSPPPSPSVPPSQPSVKSESSFGSINQRIRSVSKVHKLDINLNSNTDSISPQIITQCVLYRTQAMNILTYQFNLPNILKPIHFLQVFDTANITMRTYPISKQSIGPIAPITPITSITCPFNLQYLKELDENKVLIIDKTQYIYNIHNAFAMNLSKEFGMVFRGISIFDQNRIEIHLDFNKV